MSAEIQVTAVPQHISEPNNPESQEVGLVGSVLNEHQLSLAEGDGENWLGRPPLRSGAYSAVCLFSVSAKDLSSITSFSYPPIFASFKKCIFSHLFN